MAYETEAYDELNLKSAINSEKDIQKRKEDYKKILQDCNVDVVIL